MLLSQAFNDAEAPEGATSVDVGRILGTALRSATVTDRAKAAVSVLGCGVDCEAAEVAMHPWDLFGAPGRIEDITARVALAQARVITYGGYINTNIDCARLLNETGTTQACAREENVVYFEDRPDRYQLYAEVMAITDHYIDRVDLLCSRRELASCLTRTPGGAPMFYDRHHASLEFSEMSGGLYARRFPNLLKDLSEAEPRRSR